jgi:hypothetical protein
MDYIKLFQNDEGKENYEFIPHKEKYKKD